MGIQPPLVWTVWLWTSCTTCWSLSPSTCKMGIPVASAWQMGKKWENAELVLSSVPASCKSSSTLTATVTTLRDCNGAGLEWLSV